MIKFNTILRAFYTIAVVAFLSDAASAQSVLNFTRAVHEGTVNTGIAVTNPTSQYADIKFTLYGLDGAPVASGIVNPVSYRIAPKGQLSMLATEIFAGGRNEGWIQATSQVSGLIGLYFSGDFSSTLDGTDSAETFLLQVVPMLRREQSENIEVRIVNPGASNANITVAFFNGRGEEVGTSTHRLETHAVARIAAPAVLGTLTARVSSSVPVAATGVIASAESLVLVNGQAVDRVATTRVVPHFVSGNGFDSVVVLSNPNASAVSARVTLLNESGGPIHPSLPSTRTVTVPPNGSTTVDAQSILNMFVAPPAQGWVRIESGNIPLAGITTLSMNSSVTAIPLQISAQNRMLVAQLSENNRYFTGVALVNNSLENASVNISLIRADGTTVVQKTVNLPRNSKLVDLLGNLVPEARGLEGAFAYLESSVPIFGTAMFGTNDSRMLAAVAPGAPPAAYVPGAASAPPRIVRVEPGTVVHVGDPLRITIANSGADTQMLLGGQVITPQPVATDSSTFTMNVPAMESGFAYLRIRTGGVESAAVPIRVMPVDNSLTEVFEGRAFYQKIEVTDDGLDLNRPGMVPIRNARVEVFDRTTQALVSVSETNERGHFRAAAPSGSEVTVRVMSRLRTVDLRVADNTNGNVLYRIAVDVDTREIPSNLSIVDRSRVSGAFNILETLQRGNEAVEMADPRLNPAAMTIFWSVMNARRSGDLQEGAVGTTFFNLTTNTAYILGDRRTDSDEFDDAVILHEYAHMLAARFSRDDSPGGAHSIGEMLDPRVAWSEGFANFFSSLSRGDRIYRDSSGVNGSKILRFDVEENIPLNDTRPGYWSEASVHSLLWDMFDDSVETGDPARFSLNSIWLAFTDLRNDRFVYLPHFLERYVDRNPAASDVLRGMVQLRSIDFQPNARPSVTNPFPRRINVAEEVSGEVDSLSARRHNLVQSSHLLSFTTTGGAALIRLDIVGLGAGNDPNANDLDLFLIDANGRVIEKSDRGLNGRSEQISIVLAPATYVLEVRSYYTRAETNTMVFNSGRYRLSVAVSKPTQ